MVNVVHILDEEVGAWIHKNKHVFLSELDLLKLRRTILKNLLVDMEKKRDQSIAVFKADIDEVQKRLADMDGILVMFE
jgi:hypothetical protein